MAFSAVYYMTNYATKHDVIRHQLIVTATILKRALDDAKSVIELLRKCKADAQVDAALRREARQAASSLDIVTTDVGGLDDVDQTTESTNQCVSLDTIYQAFSIFKGKWADSDRMLTISLLYPWPEFCFRGLYDVIWSAWNFLGGWIGSFA